MKCVGCGVNLFGAQTKLCSSCAILQKEGKLTPSERRDREAMVISQKELAPDEQQPSQPEEFHPFRMFPKLEKKFPMLALFLNAIILMIVLAFGIPLLQKCGL